MLRQAPRQEIEDSHGAERANQTNPLGQIMAAGKVSIMGLGGIGSTDAVTFAAKKVSPSYMGIIDPVVTPESDKAGSTEMLTVLGTSQDRDPALHVIDRSGKTSWVKYDDIKDKTIAFRDDYVNAPKEGILAAKDGRFVRATKGEVDYTIHPAAGYALPTNMIPFLGSDSPNRTEMAARHMEQAISIKGREEPLIQTKSLGDESWERKIGRLFAGLSAPEDGEVTSVSDKKVKFTGKSGKKYDYELYQRYPLNDGRSFIESYPLVKKGDKVKQDQPLVDTNHTKDGVLALGTNALVAYAVDKGYNFEDAITISQSFADKLESQALWQKHHTGDKFTIVDKNQYSTTVSPLTEEEKATLDDRGVVKVGQLVKKGDILVAALRKVPLSKDEKFMSAVKRSAAHKFEDAAIYWDKDEPGTVEEVTDTGSGVYLAVRTNEKMQVGDKMCLTDDHDVLTDRGWIPVPTVRPGDMVAALNKGKVEFTEVASTHHYAESDIWSAGNVLCSPKHKLYATDIKPRGKKGEEKLESLYARVSQTPPESIPEEGGKSLSAMDGKNKLGTHVREVGESKKGGKKKVVLTGVQNLTSTEHAHVGGKRCF